MRRRHSSKPLPTRWLFTDERLGDQLWQAIAALPRGAGIVFRHHSLAPAPRLALARAVASEARRRYLLLLFAEAPAGMRADGRHRSRHSRRRQAGHGLTTASVHGAGDLSAAFRAGADLVFLSPVFATASHPKSPTLGPLRFGLLARAAPGPVIALGGMSEARWRRLVPLGAAGFAAIDYWLQKSAKAAPPSSAALHSPRPSSFSS